MQAARARLRRTRKGSYTRKTGKGKGGGRGKSRRKTKKSTMRKRRRFNKFLNRGFNVTHEVTGTVADPDCCYVGHSTMSARVTTEVILYSLLRKLFEKAGLKVTGLDAPLFSETTADTAYSTLGWRIVLTRNNLSTGGLDGPLVHITLSNATIRTIVGDSAAGLAPQFALLVDAFIGLGGNYTAGTVNTIELVDLQLYQQIDALPAKWNKVSEIVLKNEIVHISSISELRIQNRSLSAGGNADATQVDNNPLIGYMYNFKDGAPRSKMPGAKFIEAVNDVNGVITARGGQFGSVAYTQSLQEPPPPQFWANLDNAKKLVLNPGQVMASKIRYSVSMGLQRFFETFNYTVGAVVTGPPDQYMQYRLKGKSSLFALEDVINFNAAQNITIAYEVNRNTAAYLTSKNPQMAYGRLTKTVQSSTPP